MRSKHELEGAEAEAPKGVSASIVGAIVLLGRASTAFSEAGYGHVVAVMINAGGKPQDIIDGTPTVIYMTHAGGAKYDMQLEPGDDWPEEETGNGRA